MRPTHRGEREDPQLNPRPRPNRRRKPPHRSPPLAAALPGLPTTASLLRRSSCTRWTQASPPTLLRGRAGCTAGVSALRRIPVFSGNVSPRRNRAHPLRPPLHLPGGHPVRGCFFDADVDLGQRFRQGAYRAQRCQVCTLTRNQCVPTALQTDPSTN